MLIVTRPALPITRATAHCLCTSAYRCARFTQIWHQACTHFLIAQAEWRSFTAPPGWLDGWLTVWHWLLWRLIHRQRTHFVFIVQRQSSKTYRHMQPRTRACKQTSMQPGNSTECGAWLMYSTGAGEEPQHYFLPAFAICCAVIGQTGPTSLKHTYMYYMCGKHAFAPKWCSPLNLTLLSRWMQALQLAFLSHTWLFVWWHVVNWRGLAIKYKCESLWLWVLYKSSSAGFTTQNNSYSPFNGRIGAI